MRGVLTHRTVIAFIRGIRTPVSTVAVPTSRAIASIGAAGHVSATRTCVRLVLPLMSQV